MSKINISVTYDSFFKKCLIVVKYNMTQKVFGNIMHSFKIHASLIVQLRWFQTY